MLEEEQLQVDAWSATWHRPPMAEVDAQCADPGTIRVFVNGCFDLMHVGHFNVLRQAKKSLYEQGYKKVVLVAGIHSDQAITGQKGPPLMTDQERITIVRQVKWVDELVTMLPYVSMSCSLADAIRVKFICHGDDMPTVKGGLGMYTDAIDGGRFHLLRRTEGISTTVIIERLLRQNLKEEQCAAAGQVLITVDRLTQFADKADPWLPRRRVSEAKCVVYVHGIFDLLHPGHVQLLQKAAALGDFLLVGLHSDMTVQKACGTFPVLTMHERALGVLSLAEVDDVVMDAPWELTKDLRTCMNISMVVSGVTQPDGSANDGCDFARELGIWRQIDSGTDFTSTVLRERFLSQQSAFQQRNNSLVAKELAYIDSKEYVPES